MNQNIGPDESEVAYWQDWQMLRARRMRMLPKRLLFVVVTASVLSFVTMVLWNWLMPSLFKLSTIDFWRALGIVVLSKILFGRLPSPLDSRGHWSGQRIRRWQKMTPEERQKIIEAMRRPAPPSR